MMDLILWRHADAEEGYPDLARKLSSKGHQQAAQMAAYLKTHLPSDTRILSSPAIRTQQTVSALTGNFTIVPAIAPEASVHAVLQAVRWPNTPGTVLVVGHQPTLGAVAAQLLGCTQGSLRIKKGSLWWLSRSENATDTILRLVLTPELL
jgi:phosphohistidine phosphatase